MKTKILKSLCILLCFAVLLFSLSISIYAHSGRTDENGGHWDHSTGEYHYHGTPDSNSSSGSSSSSGTGSSNYGDNGMDDLEILCLIIAITVGIAILLFAGAKLCLNKMSLSDTLKQNDTTPRLAATPYPEVQKARITHEKENKTTEEKSNTRDKAILLLFMAAFIFIFFAFLIKDGFDMLAVILLYIAVPLAVAGIVALIQSIRMK